jgi:hypothetical protein
MYLNETHTPLIKETDMKNRIINFAFKQIGVLYLAREIYREEQYEAMIAESQAKIGPYKPATDIPVQVWA